MTLKQISRYATLLARLERAEELLLSLQEAVKPGAQTINDKMTYGVSKPSDVKNKVGNLIVEIEDLKERIKYLKGEITREKRKVLKFIDNIHDDRVRVALRYKFISGATWWQVAEVFGGQYDDEKVKKLCYNYLEKTSDSSEAGASP